MLSMFEKIKDKLASGENALIMMLGDSVTFGENHCSSEKTYCAFFTRFICKYFSDVTVLRYDGIVERENMPLKCYSEPIVVQKEVNRPLPLYAVRWEETPSAEF